MSEAKPDQVVIITGATKGLGRALALTFARRSCHVVGLYHADQLAAEEIRREFAVEHLRGEFIRRDVTHEENGELSPLIDLPESAHLTLINNACATFAPQPMHLLKWDDFQDSFEVAVKGAWVCTRSVIRPMLKARRGNIVNVLTTAIEGIPPKGFAAYVTAKCALQGLTRALASEYSQRGIRIFSVSPGFMETSLTAGWDRRLKTAILNSSATGAQDPMSVAETIRKLVENPETPGQGENHPFA